MKNSVQVIGNAYIEENSLKYQMAYEIGKTLVDNGYRVQSGGLNGVMKAAFAGAKSSKEYKDGDTIAIIPSFDRSQVNEFADIVIPTGLDILRNAMVANADAVVVIGGGAGTLSEMAMAWSLGKLIVSFKNVDGWSKKLADSKLDDRIRYDNIDSDKVYGVDNAQDAINIINSKISLYNKAHKGIVYIK